MRVIKLNHAPDVFLEFIKRETVKPSITRGFQSTRIDEENGLRLSIIFLLGFHRYQGIEKPVALVDPVVLLVRRDFDELHLRIEHGAHILDDLQLLLAREVIPDVAVVDARFLLRLLARAHEERDGNRDARTRTENLAAFLTRKFPARTLIAAQVEDVDGIELVLQRGAEAVHRARVEPPRVGDERDDSLAVRQAVGRPAERLDVGIVEALLKVCRRFPRIRLGDLLLQSRVAQVLGVVVRALLSDRIGRVADDDADGDFGLFRGL